MLAWLCRPDFDQRMVGFRGDALYVPIGSSVIRFGMPLCQQSQEQS